MNGKYEHDDGVEELLRTTMKTEIPPEVRGRMRGQLAAFRERLDTRARAGRARVMRLASMSLAATVAAVVGALVLFLGGNAKPTWAEVRERFDSVPFFQATIFVKANAVAEPVQIDLWMGEEGRLRLRAGNRVTFGERGRPVETVSFAPATQALPGVKQAQHMVESITRAIGEEAFFSLDVLLRALPVGGTLSPPLENLNVGLSDDLVVFDITDDESPEWVRIWALRESRLPVRVLFWNPRGTDSVDVVLSYARRQAPDFFDPEAFKANLSQDAGGEGPWQAYGLFQDPGGRPMTPQDVETWKKRRRAIETQGSKLKKNEPGDAA